MATGRVEGRNSYSSMPKDTHHYSWWVICYFTFLTSYKVSTVDSAVQTDAELHDYISSLEDEVVGVWKEITLLHEDVTDLQEEVSKYRNLWMNECRYSSNLVVAGAELQGGYSQAQSFKGSSPYYRSMCSTGSCGLMTFKPHQINHQSHT
jgi:hypothetical protein